MLLQLMTTYCDYCMLTDHARWNCPALAKEALDKENRELALREADDASMEELEAAGDLYDQLKGPTGRLHRNEPEPQYLPYPRKTDDTGRLQGMRGDYEETT